ncbi:UNVERIFIED_CONTAM: hypothetical protein HDU68_004888 [Siphonaria sp. JEL0065]|nr:hypothetical protein HDU68_004888 [Siphonaria sp. JEL0065]
MGDGDDKKAKLAALAAKRKITEGDKPSKSSSSSLSGSAPKGKSGGPVSQKEIDRKEAEYQRKLLAETRGKNLDEYDKGDGFLADSDEEDEEEASDEDSEEEEKPKDKKRRREDDKSSKKDKKNKDKKKKKRKADSDDSDSGGSGEDDDSGDGALLLISASLLQLRF